MQVPKITRAIPKRRYVIGPYLAVILGEVESPDAADYRYILALTPEGTTEPVLFITSARGPEGYVLRLEANRVSQEMGQGPQWGDLEVFAHDALGIAQRAMGLTDETAYRQM